MQYQIVSANVFNKFIQHPISAHQTAFQCEMYKELSCCHTHTHEHSQSRIKAQIPLSLAGTSEKTGEQNRGAPQL